MVYRLYVFFVINILLFVSADVCGQISADSLKYIPQFRLPDHVTGRDITDKAELDIDKWVDETSDDIKKVRPGSFSPNPSADRAVVRSVYKSVKTKRAGLGFSNESILKAVFTAWIELAVKTFDKSGKEADYAEEDLLDKAMVMSELNIKTIPEGAEIVIDKYKGYGASNAYVWVGQGKHILEIVKEGFKPYKETITIDSPRPLPYVITLLRLKQ